MATETMDPVVDEGAQEAPPTDIPDESAGELDQPQETAENDTETTEQEPVETGQQADESAPLSVTRDELNALVQAMARRESLESRKLEQQQREQQQQKPQRISAWERDAALARLKAEKPDVYDATNKQVLASVEDFLAAKGVDLGVLADLPRALEQIQGFVYSTQFKDEARQAAETLGLKGDEVKAADAYARQQWQNNRSGDYRAMFSEWKLQQQMKAEQDRVRAEKAGRNDKRRAQPSGDTHPDTRGAKGTVAFRASTRADDAMKRGDMTVYLEEWRNAHGVK